VSAEWGYVIAAYAVTWIGIGGYALRLERITRRAELDYDAARGAQAPPAGRPG
jgi:CcmD family protein